MEPDGTGELSFAMDSKAHFRVKAPESKRSAATAGRYA